MRKGKLKKDLKENLKGNIKRGFNTKKFYYTNPVKSVTAVLTAAAILFQPLTAQASSISGVKDNINSINNQINSINNTISSLEDEKDLVQEEIDDLNSEILNTMTSIGMKEDEIAQKESEIEEKKAQIEVTKAEYEEAKQKEEDQKASMAAQTRLIYENGDNSYLNALMQGKGIGDILNSMDYIEKVYESNKKMLDEYIATKELVLALWNQLEEEEAALEADMQQLEEDKKELEQQKSELDGMLAQKKKESANYEAEIARARQEAAVAKKQLQQEQKKLKELQAAAAAAAAQKKSNTSTGTNTNTASNTGGSNTTAVISNSSGSELGRQIAQYACQFVGNPYVAGGTSLTNGADCSGFTYRVYADFGYSLPRTSSQQRSAGTGVSYSEAQPGDLICYEGHVALYIGNGQIVHASSSRTGIKISNAQYKPILAVRRIV